MPLVRSIVLGMLFALIGGLDSFERVAAEQGETTGPGALQQGQYRLYFPGVYDRPPGYPAAPSLSITQPTRGTLRLTWTPAARALVYTVWLSQSSAMAGARPIYTGTQTQYTLTLGPGTYYFRVQASNRWGAEASAVQQVVVQPPTPTPTPTPRVTPTPTHTPVMTCSAIPGASYATLSIEGSPSDRPAATHPDINLALRGYERTNELLGLVDYNGAADRNAPQLYSLFQDNRTPVFSAAFRVYDWDWGANRRGGLISAWPVTLLGMRATVGEVIRLPDSGYHIGSGYEALVLYATESRLTLKYTREDNVVHGYTLHLENVCAEPGLLALYNQMNAQGRRNLPALQGGQVLGRAMATEIRVAIRDAGSFMDPRSRKDWWQGR